MKKALLYLLTLAINVAFIAVLVASTCAAVGATYDQLRASRLHELAVLRTTHDHELQRDYQRLEAEVFVKMNELQLRAYKWNQVRRAAEAIGSGLAGNEGLQRLQR